MLKKNSFVINKLKSKENALKSEFEFIRRETKNMSNLIDHKEKDAKMYENELQTVMNSITHNDLGHLLSFIKVKPSNTQNEAVVKDSTTTRQEKNDKKFDGFVTKSIENYDKPIKTQEKLVKIDDLKESLKNDNKITEKLSRVDNENTAKSLENRSRTRKIVGNAPKEKKLFEELTENTPEDLSKPVFSFLSQLNSEVNSKDINSTFSKLTTDSNIDPGKQTTKPYKSSLFEELESSATAKPSIFKEIESKKTVKSSLFEELESSNPTNFKDLPTEKNSKPSIFQELESNVSKPSIFKELEPDKKISKPSIFEELDSDTKKHSLLFKDLGSDQKNNNLSGFKPILPQNEPEIRQRGRDRSHLFAKNDLNSESFDSPVSDNKNILKNNPDLPKNTNEDLFK